MKKVIIIILIIVASYFIYQQYKQTVSDEEYIEETTEDTYDSELSPIPNSCKNLATDFRNAYYGARSGDVSHSQQVVAYRKYKSCLREEGFSDDEIDATVTQTQQEAIKMLKQDGYIK